MIKNKNFVINENFFLKNLKIVINSKNYSLDVVFFNYYLRDKQKTRIFFSFSLLKNYISCIITFNIKNKTNKEIKIFYK